ncbi:MAG: nuclear transport factor 2 family protein [Terracidiphilus sp.]
MRNSGKKLWFLLMMVLACGAILAARVAFAGSADEKQQVMATEQARVAALDASDVPALERIMADDVTYVHASGKVDTKTSYLAAIRSGQLHYISWAPKSLQVRVAGDAAVINGEYSVRVKDSRVQPDPFNIDIFILEMYARRDGRWQQIAWQSTRDVASTPAH